MKHLFLTFIFLLKAFISFSQMGYGSPEKLEKWKNKTLLVVLYPNSDIYNSSIKEVVKRRWGISNVEYVNFDEIPKYKGRKNVMYLGLFDICWRRTIDDSPDPRNYIYPPTLSIAKKFDGSTGAPDKVWIYNWIHINSESKFKNTDTRKYSCLYSYPQSIIEGSSKERVSLFMDVFFNTIDSVSKHRFDFRGGKDIDKYYNTPDNFSTLKSKTLLIDKKYFFTDSLTKIWFNEKLNSLCKGYRLVDETELANYIKEKDNNYAYLHLIFTFSQIIDLKERKVIYFRANPMPRAVRDFFQTGRKMFH